MIGLRGAAAVGIIAASDWLQSRRERALPVAAALDWTAHVATAFLLRRRPTVPLLVATVVIDLDHAPKYLTSRRLDGRPAAHSLVSLCALSALATLAPGRLRPPLEAIADGVRIHLVRDLATGPGAPLAWPLTRYAFRVPYAVYLGIAAYLAAQPPASRDH